MESSIDSEILDILFCYYPEKIEFIEEKDPFKFLSTVILSASNTDISAKRSADKLFSVFPDVDAICLANTEEIEDLIRSSGLYKNKARSIKALAQYIKENGKIPESVEELTAIPGIGVKTANCYLGFLSRPAVIVDTHFARVSYRLGLVKKKDPASIYKEIRERYDEKIWYRMSMVLNLHGRVCCLAKTPKCKVCPVSMFCPSRENDVQ